MTSPAPVIVIGGASGIGFATAQRLHEAGDTVVVADIDGAAAAERAAELGGPAASARVDVADEQSVSDLFDRVVADHARPRGVVNSAGVSTAGAIADMSLDDWNATLSVCQTGAFLVLKYAARHVVDGGAIVTLASLNGRQPGTGMAAYCTAKAGVLMLTEVAAMELGDRGIRVNAISPGLVDTPLVEGIYLVPGMREEFLENTPLGRSGRPGEIAAMAQFLLSDDASWITGAAFDVNGGAHTRRYPDLLKRLAALM
ncbi:SDR family oxidoreductase [Gordonia caeni]|uniref:SDR family NAD(P)-dependent oxidoreductase n=1 Tax=Gordonia caeni TaxID=1007097 RepID=A0ABP7P177_9ACTN